MIKITAATTRHISIIHKLAHEAWPVAFKNILSQKQIDYMLEMMYSLDSLQKQISNNQHFLLAEYGNAYAGYASYETNYKNLNTSKIHKLYTLPQFGRLGIGKKLAEHISEIALSENNHHLTLNVNKENQAIQFYEKIGFKIIAGETIPIGEGFFMDDYIMLKEL